MMIENFSDLIRRYMKERNISQRTLALKSGVSRRYITDIIGGTQDTGSLEAIEKIMTALELTKEERINVWANHLYAKGYVELVLYLQENK